MLELVVDNFAGGGGASTGIEAALGRAIDIAINHDPAAIALHKANHPNTRHLCQNVWAVDPREATGGRPVALAWFSPDCKHFSKTKGGKPVEKRIRDLAWVVIRWAHDVKPRVIMLENVEEFQTWGPLLEDGKPCPVSRGLTFRRWMRALKREGYKVEWRELRACDYGAPTIRKRLFLIARRDGAAIVWPKPTHGPAGSGRLPWRTAAECIDWSLPCPSIFTRKKPLAEATLRRIAKGVQRYVIDAARPFIVPITHTGDDRVHSIDEPVRTLTTAHRGEMAFIAPTLIQTGYGERQGQAPRALDLCMPLGTVVAGAAKHALVTPVIVGCGGRAGQSRPRAGDEPFATQTAKADACVVAAFLAQHNGGAHGHQSVGHPATDPLSTISIKGSQQQLVTSHMVKLRGTCKDGQPIDQPGPTITSGGWHIGEVRAFLLKYYGTAIGQDPADPLHSTTTRARFGLVTVEGEEFQIIDIGMRMLSPRELFRAQGFPDSYVITPELDGKPLTKTAQIAACGNSVCPPLAEALVRANFAAEILAPDVAAA